MLTIVVDTGCRLPRPSESSFGCHYRFHNCFGLIVKHMVVHMVFGLALLLRLSSCTTFVEQRCRERRPFAETVADGTSL